MNIDGSEKRNISNLSGVEWTYYTHKDILFFISDKDTCRRCAYYLYEINFKGENPKKVSDISLADSWMSSRKDGTELIVKANAKIDSAFFIINREQTQFRVGLIDWQNKTPKILTDTTYMYQQAPVFVLKD